MTLLDIATTVADDVYASGAPDAVANAAPVVAVLGLLLVLVLCVREAIETRRGRGRL